MVAKNNENVNAVNLNEMAATPPSINIDFGPEDLPATKRRSTPKSHPVDSFSIVKEIWGEEQVDPNETIDESELIYLRLDWEEGFVALDHEDGVEEEEYVHKHALDTFPKRPITRSEEVPAVQGTPESHTPIAGDSLVAADATPSPEGSSALSPQPADKPEPPTFDFPPAPEGLTAKELAKFLENQAKQRLKLEEAYRKEQLKKAELEAKTRDLQIKAAAKLEEARRKEKERVQREAKKQLDAEFKEYEKNRLKAEKDEQKNKLALQKMEAKLAAAQAASQEPSAELHFARTMAVNPDLAVQVLDEYASMYRWTGSYWTPVTYHAGSQEAYEWLEKNFPSLATERMASSAYKSALFKIRALPPKPTETIIPMMNAWLFVDANGDILLRRPDRAWGVTYNIKAALRFDARQRFYVPEPLPPESRFAKFLASALPDEAERSLVQEWCGSTLISSVRFAKAMVWEGEGANGKSVLAKVIEALHERAVSVDLNQLVGFQIAPVHNASLAVSSETPKGSIDENRLKMMITGDLTQFEFKNKQPFSTHPTAKWLMLCNRFPKIADETDGIWRRLIYIRWGQQFEGSNQIKDLDSIIIENELHLVVDWCLEGLQRLLKRDGFVIPESVKTRTEGEKEASNSVLAFVRDMGYRASPTCAPVLKTQVLAAYLQYCEDSSLTPFGGIEFWKRLPKAVKGLVETQKRVNGKPTRFLNLTTRTPEDEKNEQAEIDKAF